MTFSIRFKLASLLAVFGILISGLTGYYAYNSSRSMLLQAAERDLLTATQVLDHFNAMPQGPCVASGWSVGFLKF